jgi:hypothetical protein
MYASQGGSGGNRRFHGFPQNYFLRISYTRGNVRKKADKEAYASVIDPRDAQVEYGNNLCDA